MTVTPPKFVLLAILDGWGIAPEGPGNAITLANTITMDRFKASYPHGELEASGEAVGLPKGEDGNTETGHLNLGAGRIVYQDLQRINMAIQDGSFYENAVLISAITHAQKNKSKLHFMGLVGAGGVHSNLEHLFALLHLAKMHNFTDVYIHVFTDGRDSPQSAAKSYIARLKEFMQKEGVGQIASVMGRYYAMDRDQRWDRTSKAYRALTLGEGTLFPSVDQAIDASYALGNTDEFIEPSLISDPSGKPLSLIGNNDAVVFFNFRIDRPRQLTKAFVYTKLTNADLTYDFHPYHMTDAPDTSNDGLFNRGIQLTNLFFVTMTDYGKPLVEAGAQPAFPPEVVTQPLSAIISENGFSQLKITESEKERFVTFYFNGLRESAYPLEERIIIPSAKIASYDQKPEMCADDITATLLKRMNGGDYKLIVLNFPNADMVAHTGNIGATVRAVETVDTYLGKLANAVLAYDGALIVTADHGNAEEVINEKTGEIDTEHSIHRVPFIVVSNTHQGKSYQLPVGKLSDVAPTILQLVGLTPPAGMTGKDLLSGVQ